jgi:hypothetical protein
MSKTAVWRWNADGPRTRGKGYPGAFQEVWRHLFLHRTLRKRPIAASDKILITKNNPKASIKTGDLARVKAIDDSYLTLENGRKLDITEGLHLRQGYSVTSHGSQGHQAITCFPFLPASAAGMMNQRQWLVDISRAKEELRVFTDCSELLEQCVVRPEN